MLCAQEHCGDSIPIFPSSSSADEILPTLIYTLITSPPETLNVISNLHFMQRFRASGKVDGEAAYCLVNLEAAISFLETVDLASLRADEMPEGPQKSSSQPSSRPETPTVDRLTPPMQPSVARSSTSGVSPVSAVSSDLDAGPSSAAKSLPLPATSTTALRPGQLSQQQRRLSSLIQAQAERIEAGRENILNSADQAFDTINATLENSFKFLFGRLKEQQSQVEGTESPIVVPKTLADVKDLIRPPPLDEDDVNSVSGRSSIMEPTDPSESPDNSDPLGAGKNDRLLDLVGGRRNTLRDRSVDSTKSGGSSKRVVFAEKSAPASERDKPAAGGGGVAAGGVVGDLMNSINPLKGFGVPSFGRFGRSASTTTTPAAITPQAEKSKQLGHIPEIMNPKTRKGSEGKAQDSDVDLNAREALAGLRKTKPPVKRFLEVKDAKELRIGEVEELLRDYKRLAECLREAISS
ncbi:hypothetical protein H2203_007247 [Taxawa tesnikishii (nom. ined.)]|nr:hypothetical protein H2203_007247 [Dothideales sp. JES 119]